MEKTSNINIRIDDKLKKEAEKLFNDLGMNMSSAINVFLKQSVREQKIPFEIRKEYPNYDTDMAIAETNSTDYNDSKTYDSVDDLFKELDKWNIR